MWTLPEQTSGSFHGICYIKGMITVIAGSSVKDIRMEMEHIRHVLRQKPDIRDVVLDCQFPNSAG